MGHLAGILFPRRMQHTRSVQRKLAALRYLSYRQYRIRSLDWNSAPLGLLLLAAFGVVFFCCMTLAPKPYYWPNTATVNYGSSPPIATRAGWMALGCLPFVFATAGKSNLITAVTGVSHEKLQSFHRWVSYAFFVLSLVHTFPFIVYNISTGTMVEQWNTSVFYWTGVIALLAQGWLTFASLSPLRYVHRSCKSIAETSNPRTEAGATNCSSSRTSSPLSSSFCSCSSTAIILSPLGELDSSPSPRNELIDIGTTLLPQECYLLALGCTGRLASTSSTGSIITLS